MEIFWLKLDKISYIHLFKEIILLKKQSIVFTPNPEILLKAKEDSLFSEMLKKADYLTSDGIWLFLAYQILESKTSSVIINVFKLPYFIFNIFFNKKNLNRKYWDRICWSDLTNDLLCFAEEKNIEITILDLYNPDDGNKVSNQKVFKEKLREEFPDLEINYYIYRDLDKQEIIKDINRTNSKILFSTLWMKKQEESVIEVMKECKNIKLWLWIWSSFDYITWFQNRAPKVISSLWLEWLYRLFIWPNKIKRIKRIYNAVFVFIWKVLLYKESLWKK